MDIGPGKASDVWMGVAQGQPSPHPLDAAHPGQVHARLFQNLVLVLPVRHRALHQCLATNSHIFNLKVQVHILRKSESSVHLWLDSDPLLLGRDQERKK